MELPTPQAFPGTLEQGPSECGGIGSEREARAIN